MEMETKALRQKKIRLVLGGSRSGKSRIAQGIPPAASKVLFWATGLATDPEMKRRIAVHKGGRPQHWEVLEEPWELSKGLRMVSRSDARWIILDSLTTWVGNRMFQESSQKEILDQLKNFLRELCKLPGQWVIVSDEVGMGIVPSNKMGREFRDILGDVNQMVASQADQVIWVCAGIATRIKG